MEEIIVEGKPGREKVLRIGFIHIEKTGNKRQVAFLEGFLDRGEAEAIVLALGLDAALLLVNGQNARTWLKS